MPPELWIPESAVPPREPRTYLQCTLCDLKLPRTQREQFLRHLKACAKKNEDKIEAELERRNQSVFLNGSLDPERRDWLAERKERGEQIDYTKEGLIH
jgi:hypothetical protein